MLCNCLQEKLQLKKKNKAMENTGENIQTIASPISKILDFSNFCGKIHDFIGCKKEKGELKTFCDILRFILRKIKLIMKKKVPLLLLLNFQTCVLFSVGTLFRQRIYS